MGGVLISPDFKAVYGQLGTTFGGNHLACAAALAVLDVLEAEKLIENACVMGNYLLTELAQMQLSGKHIVEVRGRGLMIGIELDIPHKDVRERLINHHYIFTGCASTNILRLLPPLCLRKDEADRFLSALAEVLKA